jgi:zinc transport system substrate-binding protein
VRLFTAAAALLWVVATSAAERKVRVVASFFPLYCWTANITGEHGQVESLLGSGSEPHEYAFKIADARKLTSADLIVVNGLDLEVWLPRFLRTSKASAGKVVHVTSGLEEQLIFGEHHHHHGHAEERRHGHEAEAPNEHIWLDPVLAAHGVSNILSSLQRVAPAHGVAYAENARNYVIRLHQLDADIRQRLASVTNRSLVTYHDAFPYFAQRYGLDIVAVVEKTAEVNPTPKYLTRLRRIMRERGISVIFVESGGMTRVARRIAADLGVRLIELDTLESGPLTPAAYEERMRHNAMVLQQHLK